MHERRPTQNILHAQRPTSRHPGPCGSCCELEVTTVAKRWVRQFDADCHAAFAAVVTSGVSHRICCVCLNSARLKTSRRAPDTPDPVGAAGGYDSGEGGAGSIQGLPTHQKIPRPHALAFFQHRHLGVVLEVHPGQLPTPRLAHQIEQLVRGHGVAHAFESHIGNAIA